MSEGKVIFDMPESAYHLRKDCLHASMLKNAARFNWEKAKYIEDHPSDSDAFVLGRALHSCLLTPKLFWDEYIPLPAGDGRTKEVKDARKKLMDEHPNATFLTQDQAKCVSEMVYGVHRNADVYKYISCEGSPEVSLLWNWDGIECKARVDRIVYLNPDERAFVDIKTTQDAHWRAFEKTIWKYRYDLQAAFYLRAAEMLQMNVNRFIFIAVDTEAPHCASVHELDAEYLDASSAQIDKLFAEYKQCKSTNIWPGYGTNLVTCPPWHGDVEVA